MTQSHHTKCTTCHSHREEHHRHHGHHKKSQAPKAPPDDKVKDKPGDKVVAVKKPDEKPWSQWIAGDDGQWFYRARLKPGGGGWEYQFLDGYTNSPRKDGPVAPIPGNTVLPKPTLIMPPTSSSSTLTEYSVEAEYVPTGSGDDAAAAPMPEKENSRPFKPFEEKPKGKPAEAYHKTKRADKVPDKKYKKKPSHPKKIATVVNADRGKKFNHNKIVRGWLAEYEPEPELEFESES